ncbi:unnamed protein product [Cunninghamella blakesleeana]
MINLILPYFLLLIFFLKKNIKNTQRKTAEELRRAEEARLQYKYLDLGFEQQRRISDPSAFTNEFLSGSLGSLVVTEGVPDWLNIPSNNTTMTTATTLSPSPMAASFHQFEQTPPSPTTSYYRPPSPFTTTSFETPFADLTISATSSPEPLDPNHIKKNNSSTSKLSSSNSNTSPITTSPTTSFPLKYENTSTTSLPPPPPLPIHQEFPSSSLSSSSLNHYHNKELSNLSSTSLLSNESILIIAGGGEDHGSTNMNNHSNNNETNNHNKNKEQQESSLSASASAFLSTTKSACKRTLSRTRSQRRPQVMAGKKKNRSIPLPSQQPTSNDPLMTTSSTLPNTSSPTTIISTPSPSPLPPLPSSSSINTNTSTNIINTNTITNININNSNNRNQNHHHKEEEPHLDHGKVMEALRAKLKRTSNPLSSTSSHFFSSHKDEEETVIQPMSPQGMLLLDLKNPRKVFPNHGHTKRTSLNPRVAVLRRPKPFTSAHNHCEKTKENTSTTTTTTTTTATK